MKVKGDHSVACALCLSLLLHGTLAYLMLGAMTREEARQLHQPMARPAIRSQGWALVVADAAKPPAPAELGTPAARAAPIAMPPPRPDLDAAAMPVLPAQAREPMVMPELDDVALRSGEFGQHDGKGTAMHASPGEEPMQARKGPQDQAWIGRSEGRAGSGAESPAKAAGRSGDKSDQVAVADAAAGDRARLASLEIAAVTPTQAARPAFGVSMPQQPMPRLRTSTPAPLPQAGATEKPMVLSLGPTAAAAAAQPARPPSPAQTPAQPVEAAQPPVPPPMPAAAAAVASSTNVGGRSGEGGFGGGGGGGGGDAADPAPRSDSESDAFSREGAITFRNGRVEARFGRKVKTVRPRPGLAAEQDLRALVSPSVVMKVRVDETGRVRNVEIVKSSGSTAVDQCCQLAMYDWWFEPLRDKAGNLQPAEIMCTFTWL